MCYFVTELAAVVSDNGGAYPMNLVDVCFFYIVVSSSLCCLFTSSSMVVMDFVKHKENVERVIP